MRIIRTAGRTGYVKIRNEAARDLRLSWRARGLLAELMSYPDGWETNVDKLVAAGRQADGNTEGRDAMRAAMTELVTAGYAAHVRKRGEHGEWITVIEVSDTPGLVGENRRTENPASVRRTGNQSSEIQASANQSSGDQSSGIQALLRKTDTKTEKKTEPKKVKNTVSLSGNAEDAGSQANDHSAPLERERDDQPQRSEVANADALPYATQRRYLAKHGVTDAPEAARMTPIIERLAKVDSPGWWNHVSRNGDLDYWIEKARAELATGAVPWCGKCDHATRTVQDESNYGEGIILRPCPRCSAKAKRVVEVKPWCGNCTSPDHRWIDASGEDGYRREQRCPDCWATDAALRQAAKRQAADAGGRTRAGLDQRKRHQPWLNPPDDEYDLEKHPL